MALFRACLCTLLLAVGSEAVTPMEKVITLLKGLSTKVAAEGAKEAAQYDKYACFCKEQADEKLYSIEKSDAQIASLKAQIEELSTAISGLNTEISALSKKSSRLEGEIKTATDKRSKERAEYEAKAKDMNEAIAACGAALEALRDSKTAMKGAKVDFAQVQKAVTKVLGKGAPAFEYQSNDIIATIEGLEDSFKKMKKDLDIEEHDINSAFESKKLGLSNEKKFAEKERDEKAAVAEEKTEALETAKSDRDAETADRDADQAFLDDLTSDCEKKAMQFDQRSKTRSEELTVLSEATAELQKGAVPNFSANKKLVGLQKKQTVEKAAVAPVSFVQINEVKLDEPRKQLMLKQVIGVLHKAAGKTGSAVLTNVVMRANLAAAEDHFVKVRALIKDLVAKLKADALSEATQKSTCDKNMKKAVSDRDSANAKIEVADAKITTLTAKRDQLAADIGELQTAIAAIKKGMLEATELRDEAKKENTKTITMSDEAVASVKLALSMLQDFYKNAFIETAKYTPPKSDRSGKTVGDLAPEAFDSTYHGSQSESKGIVGILEVILSDFERTKKTTEDEEKMSEEEFDRIMKEDQEDIDKKNKLIDTKDGEKTTAESDLIDQQQALKDAKDLLDSSLQALEGLEAMCVKGEETWAERKQKREDEIAALKDALQIFEDWQK